MNGSGKGRKGILIFSALVAVLLLGVSQGVKADVPVAEGGKSKCAIVSNGHKKQGEELQKYLKKISGTDILVMGKAGELKEEATIILDIAVKIKGTVP